MTKMAPHHHISQHCSKSSHLQPQISNIMSDNNESHPPHQLSQTTHTTMSSLTTPGQEGIGIAGIEEDEDVVDVVPVLHPAILPALNIVFDCANIELCIVKGKNGWRCVWCDKSFTPVHATRALAHLLKRKKCDI